ncbi:MAG: hypothetical protein QMD09_11095, partial [Desulfatibacillaceae bacterium]|nr:hypothetical protein [Desulfatibacillaceae bacterium]
KLPNTFFRLVFILALLLAVALPLAGASDTDIPAPVRAVLQQAFELIEKDRAAEAAALLEDFRIKPGNRRSMDQAGHLVEFTLGNAHHAAGNIEKARQGFEQAVKARPDYLPAWRNLAITAHEAGSYADAGNFFLKTYELGADQGPLEADMLYFAAVAFVSAQEYGKAAAALELLFAGHPEKAASSELKGLLVHAYLGAGASLKAIALLEELVNSSVGEERRQFGEQLLHQYLALEMTDWALALVRRLVDEDSSHPLWWKSLAHLMLMQESYEQGLAAMWAYGQLQPWTIEERVLVADLYLAIDIPAKALEALSGLPDEKVSADHLKKMLYCARRLLEPQKALELLEKHGQVLEKGEQDIIRADILYEHGDFAQAKKAYEKAALAGFAPGRAWLMAGHSALAADENPENARQAFALSAGFESHRKEANDMLERF